MPWYRMNGTTVHVRGSKKLPPGCMAKVGIQTSDGAAMQLCLAISGFQCDWDAGNGKTCSVHLCHAHALQVGKNRHYCPSHFQQHQAEAQQPGLFTSMVQS